MLSSFYICSDPMPASKRKAFSQPIAQVCNDMMGIELVLHASLLHTMRENQKTTVGTKTTENAVTVQLEAHDRAEELAANNFSHPHDFSAHDTENFVDGSVSSTLPCTIVGIVNDSVTTDTDEIEDILEAKRLKTFKSIMNFLGTRVELDLMGWENTDIFAHK